MKRLLLLFVTLVGCVNHPLEKYRIIHKRDSCPDGWITRQDFFLERDGTRVDACENMHPQSALYGVDELRAGESMQIGFKLEEQE